MSKVAVVGLGYVGLPLAVRAAEVGHEVVGVDTVPDKIAALQAGRSYIADVSDEQARSIRAMTEFPDESFDIVLITVPTPLTRGKPDLSYVEQATASVAKFLRPGTVVVLESSTYPGTTEGLVAETIRSISGLDHQRDYYLGYSPERIDPGHKAHTLVNTPKLVAGTRPEALVVIQSFYDTIVDTTVPVADVATAELAKLYENTFAQVNIALANEVAMMCHDFGIDVWDMLAAANTKGHSIQSPGQDWHPGPGVGGHCLPIDPMYLAWWSRQEGRRFSLGEMAQRINDGMPNFVVERIIDLLNEQEKSLSSSHVVVLGLGYKPNSADLRESPSTLIVELLADWGATLTLADPYHDRWDGREVLSPDEVIGVLDTVDLVVIATDHDAFDYDALVAHAPLIFDCKRRLAPSATVRSL